MDSPWISPAKLAPLAPPGHRIARSLGLTGPPPPLCVLVGGPGDGKTLALLDLAERAASPGALEVWFGLDPADADPAAFFHGLVAAVRTRIPAFGQDVRALLAGGEADLARIWATFFRSLAAFGPAGVVLALDDFHHLTNACPEAGRGLVACLDALPPGFTVLVASRRRFAASLARHEARRRARVLAPAEIRFTPAEAQAFLASHAPDGEIPPGWLDRAARLDGWPLGLAFVVRTDGRDGAGDALVAEMVAEELYQGQAPERRTFMLRAALVEPLTAEACRAILGEPAAAEQLASLEADALVVREAGDEAYRFPAYLAEALRAEAARAIDGPERAAIARRAAAFHLAGGRPERAMPHLLAAGDWAAAREACRAAFPGMRHDGRRQTLARWLAAFPREVVDADPHLLLWRGHLASQRGELGEAEAAYAAAERAFRAAGDAAGTFKALVRRGTLATMRAPTASAGRLLLAAQALAAGGEAEDQADLCIVRALAADQRGDDALREECNEAALAVPVGGNVEIAASHCIARLNLFTYAVQRGELERARRLVEQAAATAEAWDLLPFHIVATGLRAHVLALAGEADAAAASLRALPETWEDLLEWHDRAVLHTVHGGLMAARGAWRKAEEHFRRALGLFEAAGFQEGMKVPIEPWLHLLLQRGQADRALALADEAGPVGWSSYYDLAIRVPRARALHLAGDAAAARAELAQAVPALEASGAKLLLARASLYEAACLLALGEPADAAFARAARLIEAQGYGALLGQDQALHEALAPLRRGEGVPAPAGGLEVRLLGNFEVRLAGVPLERWPRRKAKALLAALLLNPGGVSGDALTEVAGAGFSVDLSALRRALEPTLPKGGVSRFIQLVDDHYVLDPAAVAFFDVRAFEDGLGAALARADADGAAAERGVAEALAHYRGNLLADNLELPWLEGERERLRRRALAALFWLADRLATRFERAGAEAALLRAAELAPCDEEVYTRLMRHHRDAGVPERIRQTYWDCRKALKAHLGLAPSDAFEAAYRAIAGA